MNITENDFRDILFENHKDSIFELISGMKEPQSWDGTGFPPARFILKKIVEERINKSAKDLKSLTLQARELSLKRSNNSTTRVDLFGDSGRGGATIIELKKSKQTERQAFTELLAYANYFCSLFPALTEKGISSILIAPFETRTVRDAFAQELIFNEKPLLGLIPSLNAGNIDLRLYYPEDHYYEWLEEQIFHDHSMSVFRFTIPELKGWIDVEKNQDGVPEHTKEALNTIANTVSQGLAKEGFHSLVYSSTAWGEVSEATGEPHAIVVTAINPYAYHRTNIDDDFIYGDSSENRLSQVQNIYDQLAAESREFWLISLNESFQDRLGYLSLEEIKKCFINRGGDEINIRLSCPPWSTLKISPLASINTNILEIYSTGLLKNIYEKYVEHAYEKGEDEIYYGDDFPKYYYETLTSFLPVWEILSALGFSNESE